IGKNITSVVLSCNNYEVIDLGVMVPPEDIIAKAKELEVDMIALSGLITPSLQEMSIVASEMEKAGIKIPLLIGGATTSKLHTALKIDTLYQGPVVHVVDASKVVPVANQLMNPETKDSFVEEIKSTYNQLRESQSDKKKLVSFEYAKTHPFKIDWNSYEVSVPVKKEKIQLDIRIEDVKAYINWKAFTAAWKTPSKHVEAQQLKTDAEAILESWSKLESTTIRALVEFFPVCVDDEMMIIDDKRVPFLRQQEKREDEVYKSLIDFIKPDGDYVALFAVSVDGHSDKCECGCNHQKDSYQEILEQLLRDRLAEAATEYVHEMVRKEYWAYAKDETSSPQELLKGSSKGIRPAAGYPINPDLSLNFLIDEYLDLSLIGASITPNGAICPSSSTSGMMIAHPQSVYFNISKIGEDQLEEYASKKNISVDEAKKWIGF
ncbi:cobalamin-dependent protein, partial [Bacteroidales bacterium OttesenSCG-928-I14]|nr:cobalamin-dependent protein [Bacteroidales bacterium OttesenSCG-928-I14]